MIERVDLGPCAAYAYAGDPRRTAIALPGRMLVGMPILAYAIEAVRAQGWSALLVWDEYVDDSVDPTDWVRERVEAALDRVGDGEVLLIAKSLSTRAAGVAAERSLPAVWLTPLLNDPVSVAMLRERTARALLVGGTDDPSWDGTLARQLSPDVVEIPGADHGLARIDDLRPVVEAVSAFA